MKAVVYARYGGPKVIDLKEVEPPAVAGDGVLVRVHACSVNPLDWHTLIGTPYIARLQSGLRKPKREVLGVDFAGTVDAVGGNVTRFQPGDEVFGARTGAFAEYVCVPEGRAIVTKPPNVTFEQAASVPVAALSALQGLRDKGRIEAGQKVLINGASGGVGTFAVQIAKSFDAVVTGVCSSGNVESVRSLGADHVIDYTQEDFTRAGHRYDLILDIAGNRSWSDCRRSLAPAGRLVVVGGPKTNRWVGPLGRVVRVRLASLVGSRKAIPFLATLPQEDLAVMRELLGSGKVTPVIDRRYRLDEAAEALGYLGAGHARGKVVITVVDDEGAAPEQPALR